MKLFPRNDIFYDLFEKQAEKLMEASQLLNKILENPQDLKMLAEKMNYRTALRCGNSLNF